MKSLILALMALAMAVAAHGESHVAFIKNVSGTVHIIRDSEQRQASAGMQLTVQDTIRTERESSAGISFRDGTVLTVGEETELEIEKYVFAPSTREYEFSLYMQKGSLIYSSGKMGKLAPEKIQIRTPKATVGVRGTRLLLASGGYQ